LTLDSGQDDPALPQMLVFRAFNLSGAAAAAIPLYAM
jgi:hypothetical protein